MGMGRGRGRRRVVVALTTREERDPQELGSNDIFPRARYWKALALRRLPSNGACVRARDGAQNAARAVYELRRCTIHIGSGVEEGGGARRTICVRTRSLCHTASLPRQCSGAAHAGYPHLHAAHLRPSRTSEFERAQPRETVLVRRPLCDAPRRTRRGVCRRDMRRALSRRSAWMRHRGWRRAVPGRVIEDGDTHGVGCTTRRFEPTTMWQHGERT